MVFSQLLGLEKNYIFSQVLHIFHLKNKQHQELAQTFLKTSLFKKYKNLSLKKPQKAQIFGFRGPQNESFLNTTYIICKELRILDKTIWVSFFALTISVA